MKPDKEKTEEQALIEEAMKVYKIPKEHVLGCRAYLDVGEVVICTRGGKKVRHKGGAPAQFELTETDITGNPPEQEMVWSKKYNQRIDLKRFFGIGKRRG